MRNHTRKPACTRAWGRGIDRVVRVYPDPYPGQVYLAGCRVSGTHANPYPQYARQGRSTVHQLPACQARTHHPAAGASG
jgi:hypothetical protein